jgi:hypothetical protein
MEITVNSVYVPGQLRMDINDKNKWQPGSELTYSFFEPPPEPVEYHKRVVEECFKSWSDNCNLKFRKVDDRNAMIRIGFDQKGSWSLIGTDTLQRKYIDKKTMNLNFESLSTEKEKKYVALHVIGHALGFPHEHQNPNKGITWNIPEVTAVMRKRGMDDETIAHNILSPHRGIAGFPWDPKSIMNYALPENFIANPPEYREGLPIPEGLSEQDKKMAEKFYPTPKPIPELSIEQGGMLSVSLKNGETKVVQLHFKQPAQFHVSSLVSGSNAIEIELKNGQGIIERGVTNSMPLKGSFSVGESDNWTLELRNPTPQENEQIVVTVIVF